MPYRTSSDYPQPYRLVVGYFSIHYFSIVANTVLLLTFFGAPRVRRDGTTKNLIWIFILTSWFNCTLFMSGHLWRGSEPSFGLCLFNGAHLLGGTNAQAGAALALVIRILLKILSSKGFLSDVSDSICLVSAFLAFPYTIYVGLVSAAIRSGLQDRPKVHKATFYCVVEDDGLTKAASNISIVLEAAIIIIQLIIGLILYLHARQLRSFAKAQVMKPSGSTPVYRGPRPLAIKGVSIPLVSRVAVFSCCVLVALVLALIIGTDFASITPDLIVSSIGPVVFFIFASQRDVLEAWRIVPSRSSSLTSSRGHNNNNNDHLRSYTPRSRQSSAPHRLSTRRFPLGLPDLTDDDPEEDSPAIPTLSHSQSTTSTTITAKSSSSTSSSKRSIELLILPSVDKPSNPLPKSVTVVSSDGNTDKGLVDPTHRTSITLEGVWEGVVKRVPTYPPRLVTRLRADRVLDRSWRQEEEDIGGITVRIEREVVVDDFIVACGSATDIEASGDEDEDVEKNGSNECRDDSQHT